MTENIDNAALELLKSQLTRELEVSKAEWAQSLERLKYDLQKNLVDYNAVREYHRAGFRAAIEFAILAIRSLIVVNGGAAIGILTYLGHLWSRSTPGTVTAAYAATPGLAAFLLGLSAAVLTAFLSYVSQIFFVELSSRGGWKSPAFLVGGFTRVAAFVFAVISLSAFACGAFVSIKVFQTPAIL